MRLNAWILWINASGLNSLKKGFQRAPQTKLNLMLLTWGIRNKHWFRMIKNFPNSPLNGLYTFAFLLSRHESFFFTGAPEYIVRLMHFNLRFFYHKGNRTFFNMFKLICLSFLMNYLFIFLSSSFHQFWGVSYF